MHRLHIACGIAVLFLAGAIARGGVCNIKVVTDASPDYYDLPSMVHSMTGNWSTEAEKCWAVFYWNHIARRQTQPITLHGLALTDPIRQFNDYGYTMCSTIAGINQSIWEQMGLKHKYWDISLHTVPEVFYDGRWHMYDNSMSALYTLCDGKTIAGVQDIGKTGACEASGGKSEFGHIAKYHCLNASSPNGFLTGADTMRALDEEARCFNPNALKFRTYYYDWDYGHRYILNVKENETYTRYYHSLGDKPGSFVPNPGGKDPEAANRRYRIRGNGVWRFKPTLTAAAPDALHSATNIAFAQPAGLQPAKTATPAEAVFKVQSANVTTSQQIQASFFRKSADDQIRLLVSTDNGLHWQEIWRADTTGEVAAKVDLVDQVNGAYEILVKAELTAKSAPADAILRSIDITTTTNLNAKTQPRLNLGQNTVYVGTGSQTESIVIWPELQGGKYKQHIAQEKSIKCLAKHIEYQGTIYPAVAKEDAFVTYRIDAPTDITHLTYGGRFCNRAPKSHVDIAYSLDEGKTWTGLWSLKETTPPWDVIHYESADIPAGHRSALVRYLMNTPDPSPAGCSIYAVRIEANYIPGGAAFKPVEVTYKWSEVQKDRTLAARSHTQLVEKVPFKYTINVGGEDHPIMDSLALNLKGTNPQVAYGYSLAPDPATLAAGKFVGKWVTYGKNLAVDKPYTCSAISLINWGAGDPDGKKLTDGIAGPPCAGGASYKYGAIWKERSNPVITLDLGKVQPCASFGINAHGYPWWDALKGQITDKIEVLVSDDGQKYQSIGLLNTDLRWKDLPVNHMWPDDEAITGGTFRLIPPAPVATRFVQYKITSSRLFCATELEVLDAVKFESFDLRIALPNE